MAKKLIIFDIDGTLYDNVNKCIHQSTIDCVKKLYEAGHELVIATGRSFPMIGNVDELKKYINTYILINGQIILRNSKAIYKEPIDIKKLEELLKDFEKEDIPYGCISEDKERLSKIDDFVNHAYTTFCLKDPIIDKDFYLKEAIYQVWCFGDNEKISEFIKEHTDFEFMAWGGTGYDVLPIGVNKGRTIKILREYLKIDNKDVIAIGDGFNDISMIKEVGYGIAMGNANKKLKKHAKYISDNIENDGLAKAFKHIELI